MRTVPVGQIGGSVRQCSEFDRDFSPAKANMKEKWKRIDRAFYRGEKLPSVSHYKVGSFYFVLEGWPDSSQPSSAPRRGSACGCLRRAERWAAGRGRSMARSVPTSGRT